MNIYELFEVSSNPKQNDFRYTNNRVYQNSLYLEAESVVDFMDLDEDISDEEYKKIVDKELENIIDILKRYGRYPIDGLPKYVAY